MRAVRSLRIGIPEVLATMPTLQAAGSQSFKQASETSTGSPQNAGLTHLVSEQWASPATARLRGYFALGALFIVSASGYALLFRLWDLMVTAG
jgi:hypothetical protein